MTSARVAAAANALPLPGASERWALFLDFDGTLAHIAPTPLEVQVPAALTRTLVRLEKRLEGALAIVSGRPLAELDTFLAPAVLPGAGLHGAETRAPDGTIRLAEVSAERVARMHERLTRLVEADERLLLEHKRITLALHYRRAPERRHECLEAAQDALRLAAGDGADPPFHLLHGKDVIELKPAGTGKGIAIEHFMRGAPFAGRKPVFAGDDVTDEDGFSAVRAAGGHGIKVGGGETLARWRTPSVDTLREWLEHVLAQA